jgi:hypothetical protein
MPTNSSDRWTEDDVRQLRHLALAKTPPFEIAETLGRTVSAVKKRCRLLGIPLTRLKLNRLGLPLRS